VFTDTIYTHPTGFSSKPETALTGANVISQVTVNSDGHVTGTSSRALTPADISAASSSELSTLSGTVDTKLTANSNITGATHTKITYDAKGLVTAGGSLSESDIPMLPTSKITNLDTSLTTLQNNINTKAQANIEFISADSNVTFNQTTHANKLFLLTNSSAVTLTVPTDATLNHPIGTQIAVLRNGTGTVTFAHAGVTVNSDGNKKAIKGQFNSAVILKIGNNTWSLVGSLE
jgi:hypothetical protein